MEGGWQPDGWQPEGWQPEGWQPDESEPSASVPATLRKDFYVKRLRRDFYIRRDAVTDAYLFDSVVKDPDTSLKVRLRLYALAAVEWKPNEIVAENEHARPRIPNGFAFKCETPGGGTTGSKEPLWPKTLGDTVPDGSLIWTCVAAAANGINAVTDASAEVEPAGDLTVSDVSVAENCDILATYAGGTEGTDYDVAFIFTLDGVAMVARQTVSVAKQ